LPLDHPWRRNKRTFDGNMKTECAPDVLNGNEILRQLKSMVFGDEDAGKSKSESSSNMDGKKRTITRE
jgi:hypothetical protein